MFCDSVLLGLVHECMSDDNSDSYKLIVSDTVEDEYNFTREELESIAKRKSERMAPRNQDGDVISVEEASNQLAITSKPPALISENFKKIF